MRYKSIATVSFEFEFDEEGELIIADQAHDAAVNLLTHDIFMNMLDIEICDPVPLTKKRKKK